MRIAVLADIHGNLPALEAVAAEIGRLKPDLVFVAGDFQIAAQIRAKSRSLWRDRGGPFCEEIMKTT